MPTTGRARAGVWTRSGLLVLAVALLAVLSAASIAVGSREIQLAEVFRVLVNPDGAWNDAVVNGMRVPRTLLGLAVGTALGVAGAVMQGLTRNPLGDPGLLGVSAGAAFGVVLATGVLGIGSLYGYVWFAFAGALVATVVVHVLGSHGHGGATPAKLALAGAAVTAFLSALTGALILMDTNALNTYRFWSVGSLAGQDPRLLPQVLPFLVAGLLLAAASASALDTLALGEDVARALGQRLGWTRVRAAGAIVLLAGSAVAVAGPIVFVGLVIPHIARAICGPVHRWLLAFSAVLGACLLLAADVAGRVVARPEEVQVGIVVAFVGVPFFIAVARRRRLAEL
ncbi:iron ABC transporter permease [Micromonospora deserti]|uniref:Iron ABC transporter permease n=2 Tax=Micromonospora deserti TaxID=2070366 RepID=A0A2W2BQK3_9ACTN|nr:iron ABC transporter permease [Micromonospora deserti]